jgi:surface polysaccharide O-acyltransferase-like enzyme
MKDKILWLDFIRCIAAFSVVFLHTSGALLYEYNNIPAFEWWTGNVYDSMVRFCVPYFFILSGCLLLGKQESIKDFFRKRINKILIPFIVWSIIYVFWGYYFGDKELSFHSFYSIVLSPSYFHLWFFYTLIGLYLFIPILRVFVQAAPKSILYYFVALWFFAVTIIPILSKGLNTNNNIDLKMISGYVGYLVIGYLVKDYRINKKHIWLVLGIAILSLLITIFGIYFLTIQNNGDFNGYFYEYLSPNVITLSVSTFILLKTIFEDVTISDTQNKILQSVSSACFGIYLVHPITLYALSKGFLGFSLDVLSGHAIFVVPLTAFVAFVLSFFLVYIMQKIPWIRNCVP